tara:strand:- start:3461 stop:4276 length:816 start_codon:yes stop_codon:yes gene_type:complete
MVEFDQIKYKGKLFSTGLHEPIAKRTSFPLASKKMVILDKKEIIRAATQRSKLPKRKFFSPNTIKDQGSIGSCCGQASASSLEKSRVLSGLDYVRLSGEYVYSKINDNKDQGALLDDGMEALKEFGAAEYKESHNQKYRRRNFNRQDDDSAKKFRAFDCCSISTEWELASAIVSGWVCVVAVHAGNSFMRLDSRGVAGSSLGPGNHAVHLDDVIVDSNNNLLFDMANSWGTQWGDHGRAYLSWKNHLAKPARYHYFYAIKSVLHPEDFHSN